MPESKFTPPQAEELAAALAREGVDYLFIGKSGAILLGYPDTTQDVDIFLSRVGGKCRAGSARSRDTRFRVESSVDGLDSGRQP